MDITEIKNYIRKALENTNYQNCEITLTGSTEKADGFASYITFATVLATTNQHKENINIVVKISKNSLLEKYRAAYEREVYFYGTILQEFTRFQVQNNVKNIFTSVPMCYKTICETNAIAIVMENLRKKGYDLHDRQKPLNLDHLRIVLQEYGKLHAISFALRDKRKYDFLKLVANYNDNLISMCDESFRTSIQYGMKRACDIMKEMEKEDLFNMCDKILKKGADINLLELLKTVEPQSAILHGDCWNNNYLFKYEDVDHQFPLEVSILDWQISRLHSPVFDISYIIYCTSSEEQLEHFDELLNAYYFNFSTFLRELGCDPQTLFSYSTLREHWKKYSLFGLLMVTTLLHVFTCDIEDAPDYDSENGRDVGDAVNNVKIKDEPAFKKRIFAIMNHYNKYK